MGELMFETLDFFCKAVNARITLPSINPLKSFSARIIITECAKPVIQLKPKYDLPDLMLPLVA